MVIFFCRVYQWENSTHVFDAVMTITFGLSFYSATLAGGSRIWNEGNASLYWGSGMYHVA